MNFKPYYATMLTLAGLTLAFTGMYFMFLRPALLPEDLHYMQSSLQDIKENIPGLLNWLQKIFWVMGGYIFTTGLLTVYISVTSFRTRRRGAFIFIFLAGISSIGLMTVVNFLIGSNFRWLLFTFSLLWAFALMLYRFIK